jgi:hypothetical protein
VIEWLNGAGDSDLLCLMVCVPPNVPFHWETQADHRHPMPGSTAEVKEFAFGTTSDGMVILA